MTKIVFTCGDINGIGPELVVKTFNKIYFDKKDKLLLICPSNIFKSTISKITPLFKYEFKTSIDNDLNSDIVDIIDIGDSQQEQGKPTAESGNISYKAIELSYKYANEKYVDGIVTAPISKHALSLAGIDFPGHTEMYARWSKKDSFVMMFVSKLFKGALLTIHEPIRNVTSFINEKTIHNTINVLMESLENDFGIVQPKIAILGLNPHAGENGRIGTEERDIISPAINNSTFRKYLFGPFVPDAFFANKLYKEYDLVLGMYHDQILIPFKMLCFNNGVNYTSGLPIIRTSPDHGTAFDIAGKYIADEGSMLAAFLLAKQISINRKNHGSS